LIVSEQHHPYVILNHLGIDFPTDKALISYPMAAHVLEDLYNPFLLVEEDDAGLVKPDFTESSILQFQPYYVWKTQSLWRGLLMAIHVGMITI
jgi:hypothetical protein